MVTPIRSADFVNSIGINTHMDFTWTPYANLAAVEQDISYIGVNNLRDSVQFAADGGANGLWQQVANATGAKFDAYIPEGGLTNWQNSLAATASIAQQGILNYIEGGNEEDAPYSVSLGGTLAQSATFQQQVYATGHQYGLKVINMSFGQGWGSSSTGNYGTVGDLSAYSDYANAHTYFGTGNAPYWQINALDTDAKLASYHSVITTEMGWYTTNNNASDPTSVSETVQAKYMLDGLLDAYEQGNVKTYLFELIDQHTGNGYSEDNFGLFHSDGTAKLAAVALHNMTTLLADNGSNASSFTATALTYSLSGTLSTDQSMMMQKSDGTYWLAVWNETRLSGPTTSTDIVVPNHNITLSLGSQTADIHVFDPLTGVTSTQSVNGASSVQVSIPDHPVLIEIGNVQAAGSATPVVAAAAAAPLPTDLALSVPTTLSVAANNVLSLAGVAIHDDWASVHAGSMALNLSVSTGTLTMTDSSGHAVAGSGTSSIHLGASYAAITADLATLAFHAGSQNSLLHVDIWNQGSVEATSDSVIHVDSSSVAVAPVVPAPVVSAPVVSAPVVAAASSASSSSSSSASAHPVTQALDSTTTSSDDGDVFRFYNTQNGEHFYTSSTSERDSIISHWSQYHYEGPVFKAASSGNDLTDVFRFYDTAHDTHFFTSNAAEKDSLIAHSPAFHYEGVAYQAHSTNSAGSEALYRFYDTANSSHFYTTDATEKDWVVSHMHSYHYEGVAFYVDHA